MADGRQTCEWGQTAAMMAQIANVGLYFMAKKPRVYEPREFNPTLPRTARRKTAPPIQQTLLMLKYMYTKAK